MAFGRTPDERAPGCRYFSETRETFELKRDRGGGGDGDISEKKETQRKMTYPCSAVAEQEALAQKSKHTAG